MQDGCGCVQTPAAGGARAAGIPGGQRSTRGEDPPEDPGGAAEDDQSGVAKVSKHTHLCVSIL